MQEFNLNGKRAERLVTILRQLVVHQALDVEQMATELSSASARTIRNDLDLLITKGWVEPFRKHQGEELQAEAEAGIK